MPEKRVTSAEVFESLAAQGLLDRARIPEIADWLAKPDQRMPWFLQAFIGAGAWVAAICFVAFLGIAGIINGKAASLIPCGLVFIAAATGLRRLSGHIFVAQLCLALSIAGHALALTGVYEATREMVGVATVSALLCAFLYPLYRDPAHRFISVINTVCIAVAAVADSSHHEAIHALVLVEAVAVGGLVTRRHIDPSLRPLAYGLVVGLLGTLSMFAVADPGLKTSDLPSRGILMAGLVGAVLWVARRRLSEPVVVGLIAAVLLGGFASPGMSAALALMIVGYARDDRMLVTLGIAFFPAFLIAYYYSLDVTLLTKSLLLMGSGLVLLGARAHFARRPWARGETS